MRARSETVSHQPDSYGRAILCPAVDARFRRHATQRRLAAEPTASSSHGTPPPMGRASIVCSTSYGSRACICGAFSLADRRPAPPTICRCDRDSMARFIETRRLNETVIYINADRVDFVYEAPNTGHAVVS